MRQLADILEEKIKKEGKGGKASLGRKLGVSGEAILQYTKGAMPSLSVAIKWMEAFDEDLIQLMFADEIGETPTKALDPEEKYGTLQTLKELVESQKDTIKLLKQDIERLENGRTKAKRKKT